ncbi:malonic semialdehyde reductase [Pseudarthrobacter sp. B4EP4b]|uniref:malonic semialdehyde reductase n=1 Tax=Pseudarthrobacter sp. B4EP4b TaxID=2590664 RepID=UPI001153248D|nr:malonic semialdehyde reductase [Pseudarthrobacter sp. B4EP4b]
MTKTDNAFEVAQHQRVVAALFENARTPNAFSDELVTEAEARAIYDLTRLGPTAFNNQPLRITYLRSAEARSRVVPFLTEPNRQKTLDAPLTAILAFDTNWHDKLPELFPHAPHVRDRFTANEAARSAAGNNNAFLQAGYFIMAVRSLGLAAGPMGGFDATGLDDEFFPDQSRRSILVVNVGHPAPNAWRDERLPRLNYATAVTTL